MRFSLRSSSPMRTAIEPSDARLLEGHARGYAPAMPAGVAASGGVTINEQSRARRDTRARRHCSILLAYGVEPRPTANSESQRPHPMLNPQRDHPSVPADSV